MGTRRRSALVGLVLLFVGGCGPKTSIWQNSSWQEFRSTEGRFTALFPGSPRSQNLSVPTAIGAVTANMVLLDSSDGAVGVMYADYPWTLIQQGNVDKMLDGARDGAVANVNGRLVEEKPISLLDAPGREYLIQIKETAFCRSRIYLVKNRLYIVQALGSKERVQSKEAEKFLNSFEFQKDNQQSDVNKQIAAAPASRPENPPAVEKPARVDPVAPKPVVGSHSPTDSDQAAKEKKPSSSPAPRREVEALQLLGQARDVHVTTRQSSKIDSRLPGRISKAKALAGKDLYPGIVEAARQLKKSNQTEYLIVTPTQNPPIGQITEIMGETRFTKTDTATMPGKKLTWYSYFWLEFGAVAGRVRNVRVRCFLVPESDL